VVDDILDIADDYKGPQDKRKTTSFPSILSLSEAKQRSTELAARAEEALKDFGKEADPLRQIADYVVARKE
jgi:geranylgeranyl diphosphate synthase, type II